MARKISTNEQMELWNIGIMEGCEEKKMKSWEKKWKTCCSVGWNVFHPIFQYSIIPIFRHFKGGIHDS